jgi:hypothetical protein
MNIQTSIAAFSKITEENDLVTVVGIVEENHEPHPFNLDGEHTAYARDTNDGIIEEFILEMFPCGLRGCSLSYDQHTSEKKLMLQINKDLTHDEVHEELNKIKPLFKAHGVFRVAFVEGEGDKKFKFIENEE